MHINKTPINTTHYFDQYPSQRSRKARVELKGQSQDVSLCIYTNVCYVQTYQFVISVLHSQALY